MFDAINQNIERCGLHIFAIANGEDSPSFCYTIGFAKLGFPEQIIFSLSPRVASWYFNRYYDEVVNHKTREAGPTVLKPEEGWFNLPVSLVNAADDLVREYAVQAFHFAESQGWDAPNFTQWVWCDPQRRFPWQKGYDTARYEKLQPMLARLV